jgi:microcystin-dependent protein
MAILNNPEDFVSGENITAAKLNNLVDGATFLGGAGQATDDSTLEVNDGPGGDGSLRVKDLGITTAKLADASVTEAKLANGAITEDKIADGAITEDKIATSAQSVFMPTGSVMAFAGSVAPDGYFICNGQAVNRSTYAGLFSIIGTTYGSGNGSTTFNVPDLSGRVVAGMGGSLLAGTDTLGLPGGSKSVTLTLDQIPAHNHGGGTVGTSHISDVSGGGERTHPYNNGGSISSQGGGSSHPNVQPTIILNYLIKT